MDCWLKVVVTAPVPQILQLGGGVPARLQQQPQLLQQLEEVKSQLQSRSSIFRSFVFAESNPKSFQTFAHTLNWFMFGLSYLILQYSSC